MTTPVSESIRFQKLLQVIDKALSESRKSFDTAAAIQECFGDDASIFGATTLAKLLDSLVERVNDAAKQRILQTLEKEGVEAKLKHVEDVICAIEKVREQQNQSETLDRQSATNAMKKAKLPDGMHPDDIVSHRAYTIMKEERDGLAQEIAAMEEESKLMQQQIEEAERKIKQGLEKVEETGAKLEQTADACSFVS